MNHRVSSCSKARTETCDVTKDLFFFFFLPILHIKEEVCMSKVEVSRTFERFKRIYGIIARISETRSVLENIG